MNEKIVILQKLKRGICFILLIIAVFFSCIQSENLVLFTCFPVFAFVRENRKVKVPPWTVCGRMIEGNLSWYAFAREEEQKISQVEDNQMAELLIRLEGRETPNEEEAETEQNALHIEGTRLAKLTAENRTTAPFQPVQYPVYSYDWSEDWDYEKLVDQFYAIDRDTESNEQQLNLEKLLADQRKEEQNEVHDVHEKDQTKPLILIYHTHSQEGFADSVEGDESTTIVGAGERLSELLWENYQIPVYHHKGSYDLEKRDYAYSKALPDIERILEEKPTIEVVIDLHRDEMEEGRKLVIDLQGRPTARFMFFNGLSHTRELGDIAYLQNPYIEQNLAFSFQAQVLANEYYPGIARKIYLKSYRYNMHLKAKSLLIELGAQTNTVEEIKNACEPLAHVLFMLLSD